MTINYLSFSRIVLMFFAVLSVLSGITQVKVYHVTEGLDLSSKKGIYYALPQTLIKVDIKVNKTEYYAGPYAAYAAKYLNLENVSTNDYNEYSISEVKLSTISEPDPNQYYFVEFNEKTIKKNSGMLFSLTQSGLAIGLDSNVPESVIKETITTISDKEDAYSDLFRYSTETNLYEKTDTVISKVVVDTVIVEKMYLDRKMVEKSTEQKAVETANMITKARESRYNLLTGYHEVAFDPNTLAYMNNQLKILEEEYLSLFTGTTVQKTLHYSFTLLPDINSESPLIPVFVFSERSGIKDPYSSGGERIHLKIEIADSIAQVSSLNEERSKSDKGDHGFYYRIPVKANLSLDLNTDLKVRASYEIAQFGSVTFLPAGISSVQFFPETGGIKNIIIE